jgi:hypothetical protein
VSAHVWKTLFDNHDHARRFKDMRYLGRRRAWDCVVHGKIDGVPGILEVRGEFDDYATAQRWCDDQVQFMADTLRQAGVTDVSSPSRATASDLQRLR